MHLMPGVKQVFQIQEQNQGFEAKCKKESPLFPFFFKIGVSKISFQMTLRVIQFWTLLHLEDCKSNANPIQSGV